MNGSTARTPLTDLHTLFTTVLPVVEARATRVFRAVRCPHARADAVADVVLVAWRRFRRTATGRTPVDPADLARRAAEVVARWLRRRAHLPG